MNLLDEQMRADQRELLRRWRIPVRHIGRDIAPSGIQDEEIIPFLRTLKRPTLFTHDDGFFHSDLAHARYCLVWLATKDIEAALYVRRVLKHPHFKTQAKRMGMVARAHPGGIHFWQRNHAALQKVAWSESR